MNEAVSCESVTHTAIVLCCAIAGPESACQHHLLVQEGATAGSGHGQGMGASASAGETCIVQINNNNNNNNAILVTILISNQVMLVYASSLGNAWGNGAAGVHIGGILCHLE